jgi:hypothetical protein
MALCLLVVEARPLPAGGVRSILPSSMRLNQYLRVYLRFKVIVMAT